MRKFVFSQKKVFSKVILSNFLYSISIGLIPLITKSFFDKIDSINLTSFFIILVEYLLAISGGMFFQYLNQTSSWLLEKNINVEIKTNVLESILHRDFNMFSSETIGSYISKIDNDVETVVKNYINGYIEVIQGFIQYCVFAIFLFLVDARIAVFMILASLLIAIVPRLTSKEFARRKVNHLTLVGSYFDKIRGILEGYTLVNTITRPNLLGKGREFTEEMENGLLHFGVYKSLVNVVTGFLTYSMNLISFAVIGALLLFKKISLGTGVATLGYMGNLVFPVRYILDNYNLILSAKEIKNSLFVLMSERQRNSETFVGEKDIFFKDATVTFDNHFIERINLKFEFGSRYLLIGKSGTGKTTLMNLISGKQKLTSGELFFGNHNIDEINPEDIVSCVNQQDYIFPLSFLDNVTIFKSYKSDEINRYLEYFPPNLVDKIVKSSDCSLLSGGEKQVLSLIRCVIRAKDIYILDEPFSAMDTNTKEIAKRFVLQEMKGTIILSSHEQDLNFQKEFSKVLYFNGNAIIEHDNSFK